MSGADGESEHRVASSRFQSRNREAFHVRRRRCCAIGGGIPVSISQSRGFSFQAIASPVSDVGVSRKFQSRNREAFHFRS